MKLQTTLSEWAAALVISLASLSISHAEESHVNPEEASNPIIQSFQEDLQLIEKMRAIYLTQGDKEAVASLTSEIQKIKETFQRMSELSKIQIQTTTKVSINSLAKNTARLSGDYRPTFSHIGNAIDGAQFTRVPWRSKPSYTITALTSGYVYLIGAYSSNFDKTDSEMTPVEDTLSGKHVGKCYRVYLQQGQSYECSGYETCLIGRSISIQEPKS